MIYRCLKCNNPVKESPHNKFTGFKSYRCTNSECNSLFDIKDFQNQSSIKTNHNELCSEFKKMASNPYPSKRMEDHAKKFSLIFPEKLLKIAYANKLPTERIISTCSRFNSLSNGEKIIVGLLLNLYNPRRFRWNIANILDLDLKSRRAVEDIMKHYNYYMY